MLVSRPLPNNQITKPTSGPTTVAYPSQDVIYPASDFRGPPPKGCEVFVARLPREMTIEEFRDLFERVGMVFKVRLMKAGAVINRGFGFITYTNTEDAKRALALNRYPIRPNWNIVVNKSIDNCRLYVGCLPTYVTNRSVMATFGNVSPGLHKAEIYKYNNDIDKKFAFLEYSSHTAAATARKLLLERKYIFNNSVRVDWADPEPPIDEESLVHVSKDNSKLLSKQFFNPSFVPFIDHCAFRSRRR